MTDWAKIRSELTLLLPGAVLGAALLANFSQFGARIVISAILPSILDAFSVSKGSIGLVLTAMWAVFALFQLPSGLFGDRIGEVRVIYGSLALTAVASVLLAFAPTFPVFALCIVLLGAGAGLYPVVSSSFLTKQYPRRTGQTLSVHVAGTSLAGVVVPVAAVAVAARFGWRMALLLGAGFAIPSLVLFVRVTPAGAEQSARPDRSAPDLSTLSGLLLRPQILYTTALATLVMFVFQSFTSFFPTFLVEYRSFSPAGANTAFSAVFVLNALLMPVIGRISDATSRDFTLGTAMSVVVLGFGLLLVPGSRALTTVGIGLLGVGFGWGGVLQSRFMDNLSDAERSKGFGVARTIYTLLGSLGSVTTGVLADIAGWSVAFGVLLALLSVCVVSLLVLNVRPVRRNLP